MIKVIQFFIASIGLILTGFISATLSAALSSFIIHLCWPYGLPLMFPTLVSNGIIATSVSWLTAFCVIEVLALAMHFIRSK